MSYVLNKVDKMYHRKYITYLVHSNQLRPQQMLYGRLALETRARGTDREWIRADPCVSTVTCVTSTLLVYTMAQGSCIMDTNHTRCIVKEALEHCEVSSKY